MPGHVLSPKNCAFAWGDLDTHLIPLPKLYPGACSSVRMRRGTHRQRDKHTDARDQYTFRDVYASREM